MNVPHSRPAEDDKSGRAGSGRKAAWPALAPLLAFGLPILVFAIDYRYFGPIVRLGPFTVWTAAALGMAAYAASGHLAARPFLAGVCWALLAGAALAAGVLTLVSLPIALIAGALIVAVYAAALIGITIMYGRQWRVASRARLRHRSWTAGAVMGLALFSVLPVVAQCLHDRYFAWHLEGLGAADPTIRAQTLQSLVGSRFCWSACTNALCEARAGLDIVTVGEILGTSDVELVCTEPGMSEWPG